MDIWRRVEIQSKSVNLLDYRVNFQSLSSLNPLPYAEMYPKRESRLPSMNYSELVHFLMHVLAGRFFVFPSEKRHSKHSGSRFRVIKRSISDVRFFCATKHCVLARRSGTEPDRI